MNRQLLTEEIAWNTLNAQRKGYDQLFPMLVYWGLYLAAILLAVIGLVRCFEGQSGGGVLLILAFAAFAVARVLRIIARRLDDTKHERPLDASDLVFDMDVCIGLGKDTDSDGEVHPYFVFAKAGKKGASAMGMPWYTETSAGDEFYVATLRSDYRPIQFYPVKKWRLEGFEKERATDAST